MQVSTVQEFRLLLDRASGSTKLPDDVVVADSVWDAVSQDPDLVEAIIVLKGLPESVLRAAASHSSERVRSLVARKRSLPEDLFQQLACDQGTGVRLAIAQNTKTPRSTLESLADDSWDHIREVIAGRLRLD